MFESGTPLVGEISALLAAICWSGATILFRRSGQAVPPIALNLFNSGFALVLFLVTVLAFRQVPDRPVDASERLLLMASGALGIGLADVFFFMTLNRVGAGMQAILTTSYSPSIILLGYLFLGERLHAVQLFGVALILGAVLVVTRPGQGQSSDAHRTLWSGVAFALLATSTQAVSITMIKPSLGSLPIFWANCWRLAGGVLTTLALTFLLPGRRADLVHLANRGNWKLMIPASIAGTYISLVFWLGGMKYTQTATAAALNQTATLWTLILAAVLLREPVSKAKLVGLLLGLAGAALVIFGTEIAR